MSWATIILTGLKILLALLDRANQNNLIKAGEDKQIAEASVRILEATQHGKRIRENIKKLSDEQADSLWEDMLDVP